MTYAAPTTSYAAPMTTMAAPVMTQAIQPVASYAPPPVYQSTEMVQEVSEFVESAPVQDAVTNLVTERVVERVVEVPETQIVQKTVEQIQMVPRYVDRLRFRKGFNNSQLSVSSKKLFNARLCRLRL